MQQHEAYTSIITHLDDGNTFKGNGSGGTSAE